MSQYYGWSYAAQSKPTKQQYRRVKNRYQKSSRGPITQKWQAAKMAGPEMPLLNKRGRWIIAVLLIVISVAVVLKEPVLKSLITNQVQSWFLIFEKPAKTIKDDNKPKRIAKVTQEEAVIDVTQLSKMPAQPLALIADQGLFMLDCQGQIWPMSHDQPVEILPVITGLTVKEMPGEMGVVLQSKINFALVDKILKQSYSGQLSELHFQGHELIIYTRDGIKVKLNASKKINRHLIRLHAVLADIRNKNKSIALIDMRYDQHIVVRPLSRR